MQHGQPGQHNSHRHRGVAVIEALAIYSILRLLHGCHDAGPIAPLDIVQDSVGLSRLCVCAFRTKELALKVVSTTLAFFAAS